MSLRTGDLPRCVFCTAPMAWFELRDHEVTCAQIESCPSFVFEPDDGIEVAFTAE